MDRSLLQRLYHERGEPKEVPGEDSESEDRDVSFDDKSETLSPNGKAGDK